MKVMENIKQSFKNQDIKSTRVENPSNDKIQITFTKFQTGVDVLGQPNGGNTVYYFEKMVKRVIFMAQLG